MRYQFIYVFVFFTVLLSLRGIPVKDIDHNSIPGKVIILVDRNAGNRLTSLEEDYSEAGFKFERCLSPELGIWLCSFDQDVSKADELLGKLRSDKRIVQAQFDHYISLRDVLPDDPSFAMQWALYNIGQTGGVPDADIDATKAWELSVNNGTTLLGDTIIIAVIDDGFDLEHEDMNFWKNRNEIPGNGIDDDSNGYVDDYDGWNAYAGNGDIPVRSHGTRVAGVAGAVGNNGIGISGVGWNGRVMPVAGSSTFESTVVEAFAYVYKMRSLYDETNGEQGAFIVVTNGSFGVDFGNPDNYPIWEMMYDSLGSLGILNAAATMNYESNVDIVGDVPTNFSSEFILGVTNTNLNDAKYNNAAWGPISIDLGAPGTNILSTKTSDTYGYSTGTSLAAPQLSGSIALAFSAADEQFLIQYVDQPAETAIFLKNIILDNVDTLSGFDTLCVSGGRLNVDHVVRALQSPRMENSTDTLRVYLSQDSSAHRSVLLSNLTGFRLAYNCSFSVLPEWIEYYPTAGYLPENGQENLGIGFRTEGLDFGTYSSILEIRDPGGWMISLVLELNVIPDLNVQEEEGNAVLMAAYPNPFTDILNIRMKIKKETGVKVNIYNLSGKMCRSWEEYLLHGEHNLQWDANALTGGVYIIDVRGEGFHDKLKVVKTSR